jgi:FdhD protein
VGRLIDSARVTKVRVGGTGGTGDTVEVDTRADRLAVEEPLQIRVDGTDLTTTMRTPGDDIELVHGLLHAEGVITSPDDVVTARYCAGAVGPDNANTYNTLDVALRPRAAEPSTYLPIRNVTTTSACGVCGTTSIDDLMKTSRYTVRPVRPTAHRIIAMPQLLSEGQKAFRKTGGIHAAGAFTADGRPLLIREDVGRHNAADKVIGALLLEDRLPGEVLRRDPSDADAAVYLVMSSRASFELVQKAVLAGFSGLVAVSAATSLAVQTAREAGLLLTGFTRADRFNLYSGELAP